MSRINGKGAGAQREEVSECGSKGCLLSRQPKQKIEIEFQSLYSLIRINPSVAAWFIGSNSA